MLRLAVLCLAVSAAFAISNEELTQLFGMNEVPSNTFQWKDCGASADTGKVSALSISPDPVDISKTATENVTVSVTGELDATFTGGSIDLTLKKKVLGIWTKIPCIDNVGSCTYSDACSLLPTGDCPPIMQKYNIPCHCPLNSFKANIPATGISIPAQKSLPAFLANGDYQAQATVTDSTGKEVICMFVEVSLKIE